MLKKRVLEFTSGNIMSKASASDVSIKFKHVDKSSLECFDGYNENGDEGIWVYNPDIFYDIIFKGKKVGSLKVQKQWEAVMTDDYDEDDYDCSENPCDYVDTDFDYVNDGDEVDVHVDRLDIDDAWQNLGIGTAVLQKYFSGASIAPDNDGARRLYQRIGSEVSSNGYNDGTLNQDVGFGVFRID